MKLMMKYLIIQIWRKCLYQSLKKHKIDKFKEIIKMSDF